MPCLAANFYVASNGSDANPGTIDRPFATVTKARDAARAVGTNATRNIIIRSGNYYNVAVKLQRQTGADDSGLTIQSFPGEMAKLYGGMPLTNWTRVTNGWYMATLPTFPALEPGVSAISTWQVRMLMVDGVMAERSRYPTNSYSLYYTDTSGTNTLHYSGNDLGSWFVPANAEIQVDYSWDQQTTGASAIDTGTKAVTLSPPLAGTAYNRSLNYTGIKSYRIYNLAQGMSHPGQFYYDRASQSIFYWPIGGKDPNLSECIVPTTTSVFYIYSSGSRRPWGITFSNLTIQVSSVTLTPELDWGHAWNEMSLIHAKYCDNLVFDGLRMGCTAGNAIGMEWHYSTNTILRNSEIAYCGGSGAAIRTGPCVISNNLFRSTGLLSFQSPAIRVSESALVTRNDIFDAKMVAIGDHKMARSTISYNHISNAMTVLRDCGAFYCYNGISNVVTCNLFENIGRGVQGNGSDARDWYRNTIYFDELTYGSIASSNVTVNSKMPFFMNIATSNAVLNNVFINTNGEYLRIYASSSSSLPNRVERNIFLSSTNIIVTNPGKWNSWSGNIFWSTSRPPLTNNVPAGATIADPFFADLSGPVLAFQNNSPARAFGIMPLNVSETGRSGARPKPPSNLHVVLSGLGSY